MKKWYEELFTNYAKKYDEEPFTKGTIGEVDFIEQEIGHDKSKRILDVGCGTGRHAIELARRGYQVVGVDLSESQLAHATKKAADAKVAVKFRQCDARDLPFNEEFDLVIMLCEGGFSLMETDEGNYDILRNCARALKPGGRFIFTALNALFPLYHKVKDFYEENGALEVINKLSFDMLEFREKSTITIIDDEGEERSIDCNERYFAPSEVNWLLKTLDFEDIGIFGAKLGAFSREDPLTIEDYELLVIAQKNRI